MAVLLEDGDLSVLNYVTLDSSDEDTVSLPEPDLRLNDDTHLSSFLVPSITQQVIVQETACTTVRVYPEARVQRIRPRQN